MQRRLTFTEGASDKFWHIDQMGDTVTVCYGRRGTAGQTKTKQYASEAKAAEDAEQQVAAKLKKGYTDDDSAGSQALAPAADVTSADAPLKSRAANASAAQPEAEAQPASEPDTVAVARIPDGDPQDLGLQIDWIDQCLDLTHEIKVVRDERPFDPQTELERARRIARWEAHNYGRPGWQFSEPVLDGIPSRERAAWWLAYLSDPDNTDLPPYGPAWLRRHVAPGGPLAVLLQALSGTEMLAAQSAELDSGEEWVGQGYGNDYASRGLEWLALRLCWDDIDEASRVELARSVDARWWLHGTVTEAEWLRLVYFSAVLGTHADDVQKVLDELEDGFLAPVAALRVGQGICLFAPTVEERIRLAKRLKAHFAHSPTVSLAWLLNTGAAGLPVLVDQLKEVGKDEARATLDLLTTRLRGPGAVIGFVRLLDSRHAPTALAWLQDHRPLVYAAQLSAADAAPLVVVLRAAPVDELRAVVGQTSGGVRQVIVEVLAEYDLTSFDPSTPWWAEAAAGIKAGRLPKGLVDALPPVVVEEGHRLADAEVQVLLTALMSADRDHPLLAAFREHVPARARDRVAIALLDTWLARGASSKEQWLMVGTGCIASDGFVHHLTPMVREWPGVSQHKRAVHGLTALRNVGSEVALQAIAGIAAKVKYAAIKKRAGEAMNEIAEQMGFTRDQLEDRIIPDGGLDERGTREFSFGARRFLASVTPECKVVVRLIGDDGRPTGKPRTALPKPNQSDDAQLAEDAKAEFTALKKTVTGLAKIQKQRFEQAMVGGRRWSADEFLQYLAPHPLLRGLLSSVIWGVLDGESRVGLGRIDEDGQLVDIDDEPIDVTGRTLCIVHPVDLSDDEISRWSEVQADYELVEAFPQLSRQRYALPADQGDDLALHGAPTGKVEAGRLIGACTKYGWRRGAALNAGVYALFGQYFVAGDVTAVIEFEDGMWMGPISEQDEQTITSVYLLRGERDPQDLDYRANLGHKTPTYLGPTEYVPWSKAPRAVISEVLATLNAMAG